MRISLAIAVTFAIATASGAVAVVAAKAQPAPAAAPSAPRPNEGEALVKLKASDINNDGKWDKAEWLAAGRRDRGFDFIDADKDGFVTLDEIQSGMEKMRARRN